MERKGILMFSLITIMFHGAVAQELHTVRKLKVNSRQSDFGTSFKGTNSVVFASARKWKGDRERTWKGNGQPYLDLYIGELGPDKEIRNVKKFGNRHINTQYHESNAVFTKDSSTVYFSRNNYLDNDFKKDPSGYNLIQLYRARVDGNREWRDVQALPFNSDEYQTGHPALDRTENKLYFTSDMPGSYGETDIYVVDIHEDGTYGEPKNLGPEVNTDKREMFPFVDEENFLYFSSDGFSDGRGGLDIYVSRLAGNHGIGAPINLGRPINSNGDDFCLVMRTEADWGYFSSDRDKRDEDNIYYFEFYDGFKQYAENKEPPCINVFEGLIREEGTNALLPGALIEIYDSMGNLVESVRSNDFAQYTFRLPCGEDSYKVIASKTHYQDDKGTFDNVVAGNSGGVNLEDLHLALYLKPMDFTSGNGGYLMVDHLNPIYFDLDKSDIRVDAAIELEKVVRVMDRYPKIQIEVAAHTDSRADDSYNMGLSGRRAESTKNWLIGRGIDPSRISGRGYGETSLVNKCRNGVPCSEAEHQLNRRTEFVLKNPKVIREINDK